MNKKQLNNKKQILTQSQPNTKYDISLGSITKNVLVGDNNGIISIGQKSFIAKRAPFSAPPLGGKTIFDSKITTNLLQGDKKTVKSPADNQIATILFNPLTMHLKAQVTKKPGHVVRSTTLIERSTKGDTLQVKKDNKSTNLGNFLKQISKTTKNKDISEKNLAQLSIIETSKKFSNHYKGIQIRVSGRLRGAQRARSFLLNHGRISTQSFNSALKFNKKQIPTK